MDLIQENGSTKSPTSFGSNIMFLKDVMSAFKCGKTKLYDLIAEGKAPKPSPVRHSNKSVWQREQVHTAAEAYFQQFK